MFSERSPLGFPWVQCCAMLCNAKGKYSIETNKQKTKNKKQKTKTKKHHFIFLG
jgi:hypothetical protein